MKRIINVRKGLTLIELVLSIAILGIIVIGFIPLFILSAKTNNKSETTLSSTYLGKDVMELVYYLSKSVPYEDLEKELTNKGYSTSGTKNVFQKDYEDDKYLKLQFSEEDNLIKVLVKIYENKTMKKPQAQYESVYLWIGRSMISGK